jgi:hypothetical protein
MRAVIDFIAGCTEFGNHAKSFALENCGSIGSQEDIHFEKTAKHSISHALGWLFLGNEFDPSDSEADERHRLAHNSSYLRKAWTNDLLSILYIAKKNFP